MPASWGLTSRLRSAPGSARTNGGPLQRRRGRDGFARSRPERRGRSSGGRCGRRSGARRQIAEGRRCRGACRLDRAFLRSRGFGRRGALGTRLTVRNVPAGGDDPSCSLRRRRSGGWRLRGFGRGGRRRPLDGRRLLPAGRRSGLCVGVCSRLGGLRSGTSGRGRRIRRGFRRCVLFPRCDGRSTRRRGNLGGGAWSG